jgi:hypothetical protein
MLLWSSDRALQAEPPERFARAWVSLLIVSLVVGVGLCLLHGAAWRLLGETAGVLLLPGLAVGVVMGAGVYRRAIGELARLLAGSDAAGRSAVTASCVLVLSVGAGVIEPNLYGPSGYWPGWLSWLGPHQAKVYRILPLLPLWGAWSMLATVQFCAGGRNGRSAVAAFAQGCGPFATAGVMAVLMAGTIQLLSFLPWWQLAVPGTGVIAGIAAGMLGCRATGGLTRRGLLAANIITQIAVLLAYISVWNFVTH